MKKWRERKIEYIVNLYGRWYDRYKGERDDRMVYCNTYNQIIKALKSLPEEPDNYVCVAMNRLISQDVALMERIVARVEGKVPSWFGET